MGNGDADVMSLGPISPFTPIPSDSTLFVETKRMVLEPIMENHALEMVDTLSDQRLYAFIPGNPPAVDGLKTRYLKWQTRCSPAQDQLWLNWAARQKIEKNLIGHFQAGLIRESREANVAYLVGFQFQRQGYAFEALTAIVDFLANSLQAKAVKATIDTRNIASINLVKKLGMVQVQFIKNADHFKGSDSDEFVFERIFR